MKKTELVFNQLKNKRLTALLSPKYVEDCVIAYDTFAPMGITLEIALRTPAALEGISAVIEKHPDALILAGTVMTAKQAEQVIRAGAAGIVSADFIEEVVRVCVEHDLMCIPGGMADCGKQLALKAKLYGCDFEELSQRYPYQWIYKLFPAITSSASLYAIGAALKSVYPNLLIMYSGGISLQNISLLLAADPAGIFCASALTKEIKAADKMRAEAEKWLAVF